MSHIERFLVDSLIRKESTDNFKVENKFTKIKKTENEFLILIKPELLYPNVSKEVENVILSLIICKLKEQNISIIAASVFDGAFAINNMIFQKHYSQLNKGSSGKNSDDRRLRSECNVIAAYDFLEKFPEISATELEEASHKNGSRKLGNGLYIFEKEYNGVNYAIINAFHPKQILHFEKEENMFIVFYCQTSTDYQSLADNVVGFFKPFEANTGSLRSMFWNRKEELQLDISILKNGVHLSPSTLETLKNLPLFFDNISWSDTYLGSIFKSLNTPPETLNYYFNNPYLPSYEDYLFDIMEGKNCEDLILEFGSLYGKKLYFNNQ